ncbi:Amino acid permease [uncultured archaeon]|nr:Amino acid permease [uncultured archaeon]
MMSLGAVIGAGYLLGAGAAINAAGPAVMISYALGGLVTLLVVALLAEMAAAMPAAGSFQFYVSFSLGGWAGFVTGCTYWLAFLIGPATEAIVAGEILHTWFPILPNWIYYLLIAALVMAVNAGGVLFFGEAEFWLAMIKALGLVAFILVGLAALFSPAGWQISPGMATAWGGFAPAGLGGILGAMMMVIFAYGGAEAIGMASEESKRPDRDIPRSLIGSVLLIIIIYMVSTAVLVSVLPWNQAGISSSPYTDAFRLLLGPGAALAMNFVVLTAALSTIGMGVYATSRVLFAMARDGYFPKALARIGKTGTPVYATGLWCLVLFLGAMAFYLFPDFAYLWLASLSGFGFLFSWLMIALSQPGLRRMLEKSSPEKLVWRVPLFPHIQRLAVILMAAILVAQVFLPSGRIVLLAGGAWIILASLYYFAVLRR